MDAPSFCTMLVFRVVRTMIVPTLYCPRIVGVGGNVVTPWHSVQSDATARITAPASADAAA